MGPESWLALAAGLCLGIAAAVGRRGHRRGWVAAGTRGVALLSLAAGLAFAAWQRGWNPLHLQQAGLGLAVTVLVIHQGLAARQHTSGAAPVVDLVVLGLALWAAWPRAPAGVSTAHSLPFYVQWAAIWLGTGSLLVAGSASLLLGARAGLARLRRYRPALARPGTGEEVPSPPAGGPDTQLALLEQSSGLAFLALGTGLVMGAGRTWRTWGRLVSGDLGEAWTAAACLLTAASLLAWGLPKRGERWAAALVLLAAVCAFLGIWRASGCGG